MSILFEPAEINDRPFACLTTNVSSRPWLERAFIVW